MALTKMFLDRSARAGIFLFIKLLILLCLVKLLFALFNFPLFSLSFQWFKTFAWGMFYDALILVLFLLPLRLFPIIAQNRWIRITWSSAIAFMFFLNLLDVFYFRFHHQRASADLLYVLSGAGGSVTKHLLVAMAVIIVMFFIVWLIQHWLKIFSKYNRRSFWILAVIPLMLLLPAGMMLPTYPLTQLRSNELVVAQNSFHTFTYSIFRKKESSLLPFTYMDAEEARRQVKNVTRIVPKSNKRNVMLFIMESVPMDLFDEGPYKTRLPFFDSLRSVSTWFRNAYSYSHNSNKGITAILASLPTLTDIPLYHSGYTTLKKSSLGDILKSRGYETSFFIGDEYDDFGFAKFCNWTGLEYYSREDMKVPAETDRHTLGLHDEQVAEFVSMKLRQGGKPFVSVFYNLSTHFPNDLPKNFRSDPALTTPMNAMRYYDQVIGNFFRSIREEAWFENTVFIFCSDHWMFPDHRDETMDPVNTFRIPVMIFDPMNESAKIETAPVSQFDIFPTILSYAGIDTIITAYGKQLASLDTNRIVFTRENNVLYQAFDKDFVLGFNAVNGRTEFLFKLTSREDLAGKGLAKEEQLRKAIQALLQVSADHYRGR